MKILSLIAGTLVSFIGLVTVLGTWLIVTIFLPGVCVVVAYTAGYLMSD